MRLLAAPCLLLALVAPALAGDYSWERRPQVVFPGPQRGIVHVSPYPASKRTAAVWASDACWRDCNASCTWKFEACVSRTDADLCRPYLDSCDRACQRACRTTSGPLLGPLVGLFDW
jgi:hypothetical protein